MGCGCLGEMVESSAERAQARGLGAEFNDEVM
jgi:hypothetical protein